MLRTAIFLSLIVLSLVVNAQKYLYETRKSLVKFTSDAPLELIQATSVKMRGVIDPEKRVFAFTIPNKSFQGFNSPLQREHFIENYIEAMKYPESDFSGKIIEQIDFTKDGEYQVRAKGSLQIHGIEQERIIRVNLRISKGVIYASANFSIMLTEHNIMIPKVVNQKIAEEIFIEVNFEMIK